MNREKPQRSGVRGASMIHQRGEPEQEVAMVYAVLFAVVLAGSAMILAGVFHHDIVRRR